MPSFANVDPLQKRSGADPRREYAPFLSDNVGINLRSIASTIAINTNEPRSTRLRIKEKCISRLTCSHRPQICWCIPKNFSILITVLVGCMLSAQVATADTMIFKDLTDQITVTQTNRATAVCSDIKEVCSGLVLSGGHGTLKSTTFPIPKNISEPAFVYVAEREGVGATVSDYFEIDVLESIQLIFLFFSDNDSSPVPTCAEVGGCQLTEDGMPQTAGTVTWGDGTVDTVKFESDVPEPSAILPFLTAFSVLGGYGLIRHSLGGRLRYVLVLRLGAPCKLGQCDL